jgi:hypothetical protein
MEWIFAGIDGTGVSDDGAYAKEFAKSFVKKLRDEWSHQSLAYYYRGPSNLGLETRELALRALQHVGQLYTPERAVVLAGYSRGAAAVIETAWELSRYSSIPVHCMILFDSVDRAFDVGGFIADRQIAKNVKHCIHAIRDEATGSRSWFGGCGTKIQDETATQYKFRHFYGTHGAMGGTPWTDVKPNQKVDERMPVERVVNMAASLMGHRLPAITGNVTRVTGAQDAQCVRDVWAWTKNEMSTAFSAIERDMAQSLKPTG